MSEPRLLQQGQQLCARAGWEGAGKRGAAGRERRGEDGRARTRESWGRGGGQGSGKTFASLSRLHAAPFASLFSTAAQRCCRCPLLRSEEGRRARAGRRDLHSPRGQSKRGGSPRRRRWVSVCAEGPRPPRRAGPYPGVSMVLPLMCHHQAAQNPPRWLPSHFFPPL